jgi:methylenetetrahydrofolate dehydrogenase (NADP+) / methenyltetrahydrofolate cyclohydrolase
MKINGKEIAEKILQDLKTKVEKLKEKNIAPHLAIIIVGDNPASVSYVNQKRIKAGKIGAKTTITNLPNNISESEIVRKIKEFNYDNSIHGIIVQQPLPQNINTKTITQIIDPKKDVDGFNVNSRFEMPIAMAILNILKEIRASTPGVELQAEEWLRNKKIVVFGKGETGGKPIIEALKKIGIQPAIVDSKTVNPEDITKDADIIISAVGKTNTVNPEMIKRNVILIGVGQRKEDGKIIGDYDEEKIKDIASFYTPTPGGVGPIDVAMLLKNLVIATENSICC